MFLYMSGILYSHSIQSKNETFVEI